MTTTAKPVPRRVTIIGAGSTGRGHLGELASEAGWDLVLVDKDADLVARLNGAGRYAVDLYGPAHHRSVTVDRLCAYPTSNTDDIIAASLDVPLVLTAVFSHNLHEVAPLVAALIGARAARDVTTPLNVVCCENMQDSSSMLRALVIPLLSPTDLAYAEGHVGFPDCMISRVVPLAAEDPLRLIAEDYNEWTVDASRFVGPPVGLPSMELVDNQPARLARKFFMHNGAHAVCGYAGYHRGHTYIHEAVADPVVLEQVAGAIDELAPIVARRYGLDAQSVLDYGLELGARGAIAEMRDLILRVVRDPLRKLSREERLTAPAVMALKYGLPCEHLVRTIAAALHYHHEGDPQSLTMRSRLEAEGAGAIPGILGLPADHALVGLVGEAYTGWRGA